MTEPHAITTDGLTKSYGAVLGIVDLDLAVPHGEIFGLLGPNGAGKTTTLRLLLDLIRPTRGSASILGLDSHRDARAIRRRVGYLPGDLRLYEGLTGRELVTHFGHLRGAVPMARAEALAGRLACDLDRGIRVLSSGNRQKLGLIQAFMNDPDILILDEPTNGLDPLVQQTFYELVLEARGAGRTVLLCSHVLPEVERVCDRVAILRAGRLVAVESIADLRARAVRRLEVEFASPVDPAAFRGVTGVGEVSVTGRLLVCTVVGSMDEFLKAVSRHEVRTLTSIEPTLEEVFLAYYGEAPAHAA